MNNEIKKHNLSWDPYAKSYNEWINEQLHSFKAKAWTNIILENAPKKSGMDILDVGTGPGFFQILLGKVGNHMTGIDVSKEMLKIAEKNIEENGIKSRLFYMDASNLEFKDNSFDLVISRNMTYALAEPEKAYLEWKRVLRPGGKIMIFDANWYNFLFNQELKNQIEAFLEEFHEKTGIKEHEAYEYEVKHFYKHIITRPLTKKKRPEWDCQFLKSIGLKNVKYDDTVGKTLYNELEKYQYQLTPLFLVQGEKYCE